MNTATGEIVKWDEIMKMRDEGNPTVNFYKEIPDKILPILEGMNRAQRRRYYKENKKLFNRKDEK